MPVGPDDLASTYAAMPESQLIDVARAYDTLTEPAQSALRAEFARRNLDLTSSSLTAPSAAPST